MALPCEGGETEGMRMRMRERVWGPNATTGALMELRSRTVTWEELGKDPHTPMRLCERRGFGPLLC